MVQKILTGVDGSETAALAARKAAVLALALDAELHVISAFGEFKRDELTVGGETFVSTSDSEATTIANRVAKELRSEHPGLTVLAQAADGGPAEALLRTAKAIDADLIVIGNKRVQGPTRIFGSIAREVAANATCDLYVAYTHAR